MVSIRKLINRFVDWVTELHNADVRKNANQNNQWGLYTGDPKVRKKATEIVDEEWFGIPRKKD